jgi:hypothetical protein
MNRSVFVVTAVFVFCFFALAAFPAGSCLIFEGKIAAPDGRPVAGAQIQILDASGNVKYHVYSNLEGKYRFPVIVEGTDAGGPYRIEISHLRFKPVRIADATEGARISSPTAADLEPGTPVAVLASAQIISQNISLEPSPGTPQHPNLGPLDPNYAEYCYQQAHILLGRNQNKEAVELLKIYAQIGLNERQIAQSLQLLAKHDK